jgi:hypothetical protein
MRRMEAAHSSYISIFISPNVPVVYDVFTVTIRGKRSFPRNRKNVDGISRGSEAGGRPT